jgi:hypothetical protein
MRQDAIKTKKEVYDIDKELWPDHPTPWKGKSSEFFLLHEPRKNGIKMLNNSQKEFILVYYPENAADEVSLMEFLYKQAKDHEDRERWAKEQNERDAEIVRGRTKKKPKKRNRQPQPQYVLDMAQTN